MAAGQNYGGAHGVSATLPEIDRITIRKCDSMEELQACVALPEDWRTDHRRF